MPRDTKQVIGYVWVDSGQMMLGDPYYLREWAGHEFATDRPGEYSYAGACTTTCSAESAGIIGGDSRGKFEGRAAVFETGYGDGVYPVEVTYNNEGRVVAATIVFDGPLHVTERDVCERCGITAPHEANFMCATCVEAEEQHYAEQAAQEANDE